MRIVHVFRSPVGGIFRHVRDLVEAQTAAGHRVGIVCDDNTGGAFEEANLAALEPCLSLGLHRITMDRAITPRDAWVLWGLSRRLNQLDADVLHGHGAKGGAYARVVGTVMRMRGHRVARLYCPHGGSVHYGNDRLVGRLYFTLERAMGLLTDGLLFVSAYERDSYRTKVGGIAARQSLVRNGLGAAEFAPVRPSEQASDFLFVGMMRDLKGPDLLLEALGVLARRDEATPSVTFVGDGPDRERLIARARTMTGVDARFLHPMPAREAFTLGRTLVVPSRAESMPYIVLEAAAAGVPVIATAVGGIPEIFGAMADRLVRPDALHALVDALGTRADATAVEQDASRLRERVRANHSLDAMAADVMGAYLGALERPSAGAIRTESGESASIS